MGATAKILIIEDEGQLARALDLRLTKAGYEVAIAYDGQEGLAKAQSGDYQLVLLDIILPKLDGLTLLERLAVKPGLGELPVIVLTNLSTPQTVERALKAGSRDFLVKANYSLDDVVSKVGDVLNRRMGELKIKN